jgi:hypothetical protein
VKPPGASHAGSDAQHEERKQEALALVESGHFAGLLGPSFLMQDKAAERAQEEKRWEER